MPVSNIAPRASYFFLCAGSPLAMLLAALAALRVPGVYQSIGVAVCALFAIAVWTLASDRFRAKADETRLAAVAGVLLILPFVLIGSFWVGLGPPWEANPAENQMRYIVLVTSAAAVFVGSVALRAALASAGERFYSTFGIAAMMLAGPLYMFGEAILLAASSAAVRTGQVPAVFVSLSEFQDILMFFGSALTYVAAAVFSVSMSRAGWLGRGASRAFVGVSLVALGFLVWRGLQFPDPTALSAPWYTVPGLIAGIPAVPFIVPYFLGVISLRGPAAADSD